MVPELWWGFMEVMQAHPISQSLSFKATKAVSCKNLTQMLLFWDKQTFALCLVEDKEPLHVLREKKWVKWFVIRRQDGKKGGRNGRGRKEGKERFFGYLSPDTLPRTRTSAFSFASS